MSRTLLNGAEQILAGSIPWSAMVSGAIVPVASIVGSGSNGQALIGNGSNVPAWTTLGGDVSSVSGVGSVTVGSIGGKAVSLGGSLTTSGAFGLTLTMSGTTSLTLPASGTVTAQGNSVTGSGSLVLATSPTIGGATLTSATVTLAGDPSTALGAATKQYVDANSQGLSVKPSAIVATTAGLAAYTYANGASGVGATITFNATGVQTIDGHALALNDVVLVKNETSGNAPNNGLYTVTTAPAVGVAGVLTRSLSMDASTEFQGGFVFVETGTINAAAGFVCTNSAPVTVGTTNISFTQFSGAAEIVPTIPIAITGNTISLNANGVTYSFLQQIAASSLVGNATGSLANATGITLGATLAFSGSALQTAAMTGDVTTSANSFATTINHTSGAGFVKYTDFITNEIPSGTLNGSNTTFTLANTPAGGSGGASTLDLMMNGVSLLVGAGNDYTISGTTITMLFAPVSTDRLTANYTK